MGVAGMSSPMSRSKVRGGVRGSRSARIKRNHTVPLSCGMLFKSSG